MTAFQIWERQVNKLMLVEHGVGVDDIPDMPYHDWFLDEMLPEDAVLEAIEITNRGDWL